MSAQPYHSTPSLPAPLAGLLDLALDLRWSWSHSSDQIWRQLAPDIWRATHNPWHILQTVGYEELEQAAEDPEFLKLLRDQLAAREEMLSRPSWFELRYLCAPQSCLTGSGAEATTKKAELETPFLVAYFCMEFGLSEALPLYGGGLGVLAGDFLKTASDLGVPLVGVGLLWQQGYFRQSLNTAGEQLEFFPYNDPGQLPMVPLRDTEGQWVVVEVELPRRALRLRAWEVRAGRTRLYLLDSNDPLNSPADRGITSELYGGGIELRLQQEIALGIGGWRLLRQIGLDPVVCHLNEGHAAFAILERARWFMEDHGVDFKTALAATRAGNVFTTHTPVDAGFDRFPPGLIKEYLGPYAASLGLTVEQMLELGCRQDEQSSARLRPDEPFNMAYLAIRGSGAVNGVSRLHGEVSRRLFQELFPRWPRIEVPVGHVTNGVHVPSWDSAQADALWTRCCGKDRWLGDVEHLGDCIRSLADEELWNFRCAARARLVAIAREHVLRQGPIAGSLESLGQELSCLCNPDTLTLGFARRFATYKRPDLLLHDPDRLERLLCQDNSRAQLILAGKAHPADAEGKAIIKRWTDFISRCQVRPHVVFLVDYDMDIAEHLVQGVDLWINTPRRPWEASGTSGMKVLVNGGLNLSELDGWWAEAYAPDVGWALGDGLEHDTDPSWDAIEAHQLYELLETEIIPEFYDRDEQGIPRKWVARVRESMARLTPRYSGNRMLKDYLETYYLPAAASYRARARRRQDHPAALAAELVRWRGLLDEHWGSVRFLHYEAKEILEDQNLMSVFQVEVDLGIIPPQAVQVELYADARGEGQPERHPMAMVLSGRQTEPAVAGPYRFEATLPFTRPVSDYTPRVIPWHQSARVPLEANQILWLR